MAIQLKGITLTCNYPDDTIEVAILSEMTLSQLCEILAQCIHEEPDMTSFVLVAAIDKVETKA